MASSRWFPTPPVPARHRLPEVQHPDRPLNDRTDLAQIGVDEGGRPFRAAALRDQELHRPGQERPLRPDREPYIRAHGGDLLSHSPVGRDRWIPGNPCPAREPAQPGGSPLTRLGS